MDDIVLAAKTSARLEEVKRGLAQKFDIKDNMGKLHHTLGMKIVQDDLSAKVWIGQPRYTNSLLQKFGIETAKPVATPVDVKRIMRYLQGTVNLGLVFTPQVTGKCVGYSDADWGGDMDDRKSTSGYLFQVSGGPVRWRSKKQTCVALSTTEAEYIALASAAQEALWHFDLCIT